MRITKIAAIVTTLTLGFGTGIAFASDETPTQHTFSAGISRLSGDNRYETNAKIASRIDAPEDSTVYVISSQVSSSVDALVAAASAAEHSSPILLMGSQGVTAQLGEQISRLDPKRIIVVGNILAEHAANLRVYAPVEIVTGADRYETALAIAKFRLSTGKEVFVANGNSQADVTIAAVAAAQNNGQVVLTKSETLPGASALALEELDPSSLTIIGGTNAVSDQALSQIVAAASGVKAKRVGGANRYDTAAKAMENREFSTVYYANDKSGTDTISAIPLLAQRDSGLLLVKHTCAPNATINATASAKAKAAVIIGGQNAISDKSVHTSCETLEAQALAQAQAQAQAAQAAAQAALAAAQSRNPHQIAQNLMPGFGLKNDATQMSCLINLWNRESGWRTNAGRVNGPYGIPQANPGTKMASAGADWRTNPETQIKWGLGYVKARYGSACGAWNHFQAKRWY